MKALETSWKGYRFRSRTEARWAVALSAAGIAFEYEPNGFDLPSGWYLPDFWLPERKSWLEIKGQEPNPREVKLAQELASASGRPVMFGVGPPNPDSEHLTVIDADGAEYEVMFQMLRHAYERARGERFDGKTTQSVAGISRLRGW